MTQREANERPDDEPDATISAGSAREVGDTIPGRTMPASFSRATALGTTVEADEADALAQIAPVGGLFGGRFEIVEELGRGGMGAVYRARDRQVNGRELALKVLLKRYSQDARFRELFFQEIHAAQKFVSENVVQVRDTGQAPDGTLFLTMDLVQGESLRSLLDREHVLNPRQALEITRQVLEGLASGHEAGFVHRDIKPSNVMLAARVPKTDANPFGIGVRLLDFGIAGLAAQLDTGTLTGTPKYMSPEQVQAQRLDSRSDLFAVGVLLYEMMSGARPFEGETLEEVTTSVIETDLAPMIARMEELSPPMRKILRRALQKDREERFQNAAEFIRAIERSRAFRIPKVMPTWVLVVFVLVIAAAGVQAKMLVDQQATLKAYEARLQSASGDLSLAVIEANNSKAAEIQSLKDQVAALQGELEKRSAEVSGLQAQISEASDNLTLKNSVRYTDETEISRLRREQDSYNERQQRMEDDLAQVRDENEKLRQKLAERERQASLTGRLAEGFDDILTLVVRGSGPSARAELVRRRNLEGIFDKRDLDGFDFLEHLTFAADRLHGLGEQRVLGEPIDAGELDGVDTALLGAEHALSALEVQGQAWLDFRVREDAPDPKRMEAARSALSFAQEQRAGLRKSLGAVAQVQWSEIADNGSLQDPSKALAYAREHGPELPSQLLEALAAALKSDFANGAELDFERLGALSALEGWDVHLADGAQGFDPAASATVALFAHARRVLLGQEGRTFDWSPYPLVPVEGRTRDWRMELRLLDEGWSNGALWPTEHRRRAVFYNEHSSALRWLDVAWQTTTADGWQSRQRQFKLDGQMVGDATVKVQRQFRLLSKVLGGGPQAWLPLYLGAHVVGLEPLPQLHLVQPPSQLGLLPEDLSAFRAEYAASTEPCLVVQGPSSTLWLSPVFGVVREQPMAPGVPAWSLVFAPPRR